MKILRASIYLSEVINSNTKTMSEICSKLTVKIQQSNNFKNLQLKTCKTDHARCNSRQNGLTYFRKLRCAKQ